jgi:hypothetical protein
MTRLIGVFIALVLTVVIASSANASEARSLCGLSFKDRSQLEEELRARNARFFAGQGMKVALQPSRRGPVLWWITTPGAVAYPAIACAEKSPSTDGGLKPSRAQVACENAKIMACDALRQDIAQAKF